LVDDGVVTMPPVTETEKYIATSPTDQPDPQAMAAALHAELVRRSAVIATAESLTGGELGVLLSAAPGASETYLGGIISYATEVKRKLLQVSAYTVDRHGVVSAECATEMALGARALFGADYAVSTTGVAGPAAQEGKPVGLVYVGVAGPDGVSTQELRLDGDRAEIRKRSCMEAMSVAMAQVVGVTG
jgi:nicotinamide-nucleotide amidase